MKIWNLVSGNIFIKNILLAIVIIVLLVVGTLWGLSIYTQHGKAVLVPDVKGLQVEEAASFFEKNTLRYEVVDSAYIKNAKPGSIVELTPQAGTKVKENRIVFLTINAFSAQTLIIPEVKDLSQRQALAMLSATGFENVSIDFVPGTYRDLVIGLECRGHEISAGDRLPIYSRLVLKVSSGTGDLPSDSVVVQGSPDESWF